MDGVKVIPQINDEFTNLALTSGCNAAKLCHMSVQRIDQHGALLHQKTPGWM
ncbi:hypothetical protein P775_00785 [Puniceibacterium antarcticum]|uniref:Uncharacterized protein n=1 Tax=Puniceibacterium antarcticum TaxID=1206336 RepID=A0A2G8RKU5_9RHOB|nr:hypothetical protein P775_00785 [Puniceibacterium antarcticum]